MMKDTLRVAILAIASTMVFALQMSARASGSPPHVWDDFRNGFTTTGPDAKWAVPSAGSWSASDGVATTRPNHLQVAPSAKNPRTGEPAFSLTVPQEPPNGQGLPGSLDHVKWLAFMNHTATSGYQGFDAVDGEELACETKKLSGRTFGTAAHPFGAHVADPDDDLRLASVGMPVLDPETSMIFDFFVTNKRVYAFYERVPDSRPRLGNYAAFTYAIPVGDTKPGAPHDFRIAYTPAQHTVRWILDGREVFRVDRIGELLPTRDNLMLDNGGEPTIVKPRQLSCGIGLFTILDGAQPGARMDSGLVRLSSAPNHYFRPSTGAPNPQSFFDDYSAASNRLFGQGASLSLQWYSVSSRTVG
ncbi:DUF6081 family protein [Nocardia transvalensis]|uniref:DUF6081 family protein n=1 Tax=Nocardia transvalensis TaxID=37333 RepID=UPI001893D9E9|nr:DUF6081 family protein [Nocardia transvalensis]MBF6328250.1 hypothetical protein [Nocardia transvalensis]